MPAVYFSKSIEPILEKLDFSKLGKRVAIKVHFGEQGCKTYINPQLVRTVYDAIVSTGRSATLVECNVLYRGSRTNTTDHLKTARAHGFDMPIDILDGEFGQEFTEINKCKIGAGIEKYDSLVVISHFKGHIAAGFGGAIKNVGMGLGSRAGKLEMHAGIHPIIGPSCTGCQKCIESCNAKAITLTPDHKAYIDPKLCEGCAMCIAVCPHHVVALPWENEAPHELQKRVAQYAKAVLSRFPNTIFINVLENITKDCDCFGIVQKPIMDNVGILATQGAESIVAIDKASLDLADKHSHHAFSKLNSIDKELQITQAKDHGLGSSTYTILES